LFLYGFSIIARWGSPFEISYRMLVACLDSFLGKSKSYPKDLACVL